jgi:hypothetical protein
LRLILALTFVALCACQYDRSGVLHVEADGTLDAAAEPVDASLTEAPDADITAPADAAPERDATPELDAATPAPDASPSDGCHPACDALSVCCSDGTCAGLGLCF